MKRSIRSGLLVAGIFVSTLLQAQATDVSSTSVDFNSLSDLEVMVMAIEQTTPVPATNVPDAGNFYSTQHLPGTDNEWPPLPGNIFNLPVWPLGGDFYLMDDVGVDLNSFQTKSARSGLIAMASLSPEFSIADFDTNLWIAQWGLVSGGVTGVASNTLADVSYELQTNADLTTNDWISTGLFIVGSETTNWTALPILPVDFSTNLFYRLRSWESSDGSGIPDWWQLQNFGYVGVDPYGDPDEDGWNNLQEFLKGTDPNSFDTPPAPQGLTVSSYNAGTSTATLTWLASPGAVNSYVIQTPGGSYTVSSGTSYVDASSFLGASYQVKAIYPHGPSLWSTPVSVPSDFPIYVIAGQQGSAYMVIPSLPTGAATIRITRDDLFAEYMGNDSFDANFDIPISSITNNLCLIPDNCEEAPLDSYGSAYYSWSAQILDSNNFALSQSSYISVGYVDQNDGTSPDWLVPPYFDGRAQLKQNLIFQLRAANADAPFQLNNAQSVGYNPPINTVYYSSNYVYAGFYGIDNQNPVYGDNWMEPTLQVSLPFDDNYMFFNSVFNSTNLDASGFLTNITYDYFDASDESPVLQLPPVFQFQIPSTSGPPIASLLSANVTTWLCLFPFIHQSYASQDLSIGFTGVQTGINSLGGPIYLWTFNSGIRNYWGLPFASAKVFYLDDQGNTVNSVLNPGNTFTDYVDSGAAAYMNATPPQFQTVAYDFWNLPLYSYIYYGTNSIPGTTNFVTGRTSDLLITSVGNPNFNVAGYAKLAVTNGYSGVFGYLGQYFDKGYQMTNGIATTNQTGVLSPYGQFFATEPGPAALVTMADPDTGEQGTATVYCVSLQLDANHDGTMDTSFSGPDQTSSGNPYVFWANNNFDRGHTVDGNDFEQDDLSPAEVANLNVPAEQKVPDCQYVTNGYPAIPCTRDLEDYFRMWLPGTASAMKAMPSNYTVQLTLTGDGQIRIFRAVEPDGGTNYLFDETTASNQVAQSASLYVGLLTSSSPIIFNVSTSFNEHFIFCGAQTGSAQVDLQVLDGNQNVVANAPVFLQIKDIKQMYERWTVGESPGIAPMNEATWQVDNMAFRYPTNMDNTVPYILFVHGWNMETWEKDRYAEASYKRLYWQGYKGRFGLYRWPTGNKFSGIISALIDARNYDNSESNAWASAVGLTNLLTQLNATYPDNIYLMAHSMGNVVAGEALRKASSQLVNTYVAMQGAVPADCYDSTTATRAIVPILGLGQDDGTPNRYANYYNDGSPCYFNDSAGAGTYVNFYNINDYALSVLLWQFDQNLKPDNATTPAYHYVTPSGTHPSGFYRQSGSIETDLYFPDNTYELFAYCDEARCFALGAQPDVGGAFQILGVSQQVNLPSIWPADTHPNSTNNPYSEHVWHSAQFRSDNMSRAVFWHTILTQMDLSP